MTAVLEEKKSTHKVEIVPVELLPHPNADLLSIIPVFGYTYVGRTQDWIGVKRGAYIPPDSVVNVSRPEFAFLAATERGNGSGDGTVRIKAKKLRGVVSFGLMVPVPDDTPLGDDWADRLGVEHYEPPLRHEKKAKGVVLGGEELAGPAVHAPKYDLDAFRRYHHLFEAGEPVIVTEKLDGANARYVFHDGQMFCGSRTRWTREFPDYSHVTVEYLTNQGCPVEKAEAIVRGLASKTPKRNIWWQALHDTFGLELLCEENPGTVVYGEVYGDVNCIKYGLGGNRFAAFDVMQGGRFLDPLDAYRLLDAYGVPRVPQLHLELDSMPELLDPLPYDFNLLCEMAEGKTFVPGSNAIREGIVVSPLHEREDPHLGRVKLKIVSATYLEKFR